jgi:GDP/UDP-N,N'-diacetylbacillosamine 2-epimerase (hydrolysing)
MAPRKVLAVTGIRSEYDLLYAVLQAIQDHPAFDLQVVVTGAHCSERFGGTEAMIRADGFAVADRIESLLDSSTLAGRAKSLGIQVLGLVQTVERVRPDFLLVAGDREESLATALCGAYMHVAVAHLCGGDYAVGNVDDSVRHAVTKLAHLHFPMSEQSAERIRRLGEEPWRVTVAGHPGLDRLRTTPDLPAAELARRLDLDVESQPLALVLQHVISSEAAEGYNQMAATLEAVRRLGLRCVIIRPNSDAGREGICRAIDEWLPRLPGARVFVNVPRLEFVNLLRRVSVLVGNSSMGILEAPFLKLPVVNVGNRQKGREHAANVLFVPHDPDAIAAAVTRAIGDPVFRRQLAEGGCPFGDGHAGERVARVLAQAELGSRLLVKEGTY